MGFTIFSSPPTLWITIILFSLLALSYIVYNRFRIFPEMNVIFWLAVWLFHTISNSINTTGWSLSSNFVLFFPPLASLFIKSTKCGMNRIQTFQQGFDGRINKKTPVYTVHRRKERSKKKCIMINNHFYST